MKKIILLLLFLTAFYYSKAQYSFNVDTTGMSFDDKSDYAEYFISEERYSEAIAMYNSLLAEDPDNNDINFRLGFCYLFSNERYLAISHLEKVINDYKASTVKHKKFPTDAYYYLGEAYFLNYDFISAETTYNELLAVVEVPADKEKLQKKIKTCKDAQEIFEAPVDIIVTKLGIINSNCPDHSPVINADESMLMFTSRREGSTGELVDVDGFQFEDIYVFDKTKGINSKPVKIDTTVNSTEHEATCGMSIDGQELFIYKSTNLDDGDIYYSKIENSVWTTPVKLSDAVNTSGRESHATVSSDGKKLFFTSNREGGFGGMDIYVAEKQSDGTWGNTKNLGASINTALNEEGPYIHPDNKTLYFSSEGHKTMGGYDVFISTLSDNGMWGEPVNMGFPLNTVDNDVFFVPTIDGNRGYYSSQQDGKSSIYIVDIFDENNKNLILVNGHTYDSQISTNSYPLTDVVVNGNSTTIKDRVIEKDKTIEYKDKIFITDRTISKTDVKVIDSTCVVPYNTEIYVIKVQKNYVDNVYEPLEKNGKYVFVLYPQNEYLVYYEADNHMYDLRYIYEKERGFYNVFYKAEMDTLLRGSIKEVKETPYNDNTSTFSDRNKVELDILSDFMKKYDYLYVNFSTHNYNDPATALLTEREQKAVDYLIGKGIKKDRIVTQYSPNTIAANILEYTILDELTLKELKDDKIIVPVATVTEIATTLISNITFDINKFETTQFNDNLNLLAKYLKENKNAKIQLEGFTDTQGLEEYNKNLSKKRATFVQDYLIAQGVDKKQLSVAGKGYEVQISLNKNDKGEYVWESLPYNRRVEINVQTQGEISKLLVKQVEVPKDYILTGTKDGATIYSIQFMTSKENKDIATFKDLANVKVYKDKSGNYNYYYGSFKNLSAAQTDVQKIKATYKDAFVFINSL